MPATPPPQYPSPQSSTRLSSPHSGNQIQSVRSSPLTRPSASPSPPDSPSAQSGGSSQPPLTPPASSSLPSTPSSPVSFASARSPSSPARDSPHAANPKSSELSATAPKFQSRLFDPPIDIHHLVPGREGASLPPPLAQTTPLPVIGEKASGSLFDGPAADGGISLQSSRLTSAFLPDVHINGSLPHIQLPAGLPASNTPGPGSSSPLKSSASFQVSPTVSSSSGRALGTDQPSSEPADPDGSELRTPNVYINGLPPNFSEEELYNMTCEFGRVVSVRTFTRHVCDKPSGYGFVLFETIEAAEQCIETLRKFRNLHPSFSKQIHKIPGTIYSSPNFSPPVATPSDTCGPADAFKTRMEQLKDPMSTNLYIEGLPPSTDDRALAALILRHRILSSRFFQARLGKPPRLIAFVRLETREAAEEVIQRLHGRHVRGRQDAGSRISVRFADTNEQRELRRITRGNDHSPARLTIAQAALLSMQGAQLSPQTQGAPLGTIDVGLLGADPRSTMPMIPTHLASHPLNGMSVPSPPLPPTLPHNLQQYLSPSPDAMHNVSVLVDGQYYDDFGIRSVTGSRFMNKDLRIPPQDLQAELLRLQTAQLQLGIRRMATRAENGFTPTEQMIWQARAERQQTQQMINAEREQQLKTLMLNQTHGLGTSLHEPSRFVKNGVDIIGEESAHRFLDILPPISENDFHAGAVSDQLLSRQSFANLETARHSSVLRPQAGDVNASFMGSEQPSAFSRDLDSQLALTRNIRQRNQTHAFHARVEMDAHEKTPHIRSTTLPSKYLSSRLDSQNFLQNSNTNNYTKSSILGTGAGNNGIMNKTVGSISLNNSNIRLDRLHSFGTNSLSNTTLSNNNSTVSRDNGRAGSANTGTNSTAFTLSSNGTIQGGRIGSAGQASNNSPRGNHAFDGDEEGDPLVSPALTYSVRTPASLSPATPFSGFFRSEETFNGPELSNGKGHVDLHLEAAGKQKISAGK